MWQDVCVTFVRNRIRFDLALRIWECRDQPPRTLLVWFLFCLFNFTCLFCYCCCWRDVEYSSIGAIVFATKGGASFLPPMILCPSALCVFVLLWVCSTMYIITSLISALNGFCLFVLPYYQKFVLSLWCKRNICVCVCRVKLNVKRGLLQEKRFCSK